MNLFSSRNIYHCVLSNNQSVSIYSDKSYDLWILVSYIKVVFYMNI